MQRHLVLILVAFSLLSNIPVRNRAVVTAATAPAPAVTPSAPALQQASSVAPPLLPRSCIRGAPLSDFNQPVCCVSGYVYLNGTPVSNASVTISTNTHNLPLQTQSGPGSNLPYFF